MRAMPPASVGIPRCLLGQPQSKSNLPHNYAFTVYSNFCFLKLLCATSQLFKLDCWTNAQIRACMGQQVWCTVLPCTGAWKHVNGKWRFRGKVTAFLFTALIDANTVHSSQVSFGIGIVHLSHLYTGRSFTMLGMHSNYRASHECVSHDCCVQ